MSQRKTRLVLLGIFGGMGVIYLVIAVVMGFMAHTMTAEQILAMDGAPAAFPILKWVLGGLGIGFLAAGAGTYIGMSRAEKRREEMFLYGHVVKGTVEKVKCNHAVRVNNRSPWYVYVRCQHPVMREEVTVRSHSVYDLTVQQGDTVRVAFDPLDERKHAVELPERTVQS